METSASFEARSAPLPYLTKNRGAPERATSSFFDSPSKMPPCGPVNYLYFTLPRCAVSKYGKNSRDTFAL